MNAVDTNILFYAQDPRDPRKKAIASSLIGSLTDGILLWQVICEFIATSRKLEPFGYDSKKAYEDVPRPWPILGHGFARLGNVGPPMDLMNRRSVSFWDPARLSRRAWKMRLIGFTPKTSIRTTGLMGWRSSIRFDSGDTMFFDACLLSEPTSLSCNMAHLSE